MIRINIANVSSERGSIARAYGFAYLYATGPKLLSLLLSCHINSSSCEDVVVSVSCV